MPTWTIQFLPNLITSLIISVVTAVLTVQLSLRRFQAERWWDRKADAYSRIIEAMHHVVAYVSALRDDWSHEKEYSDEYKAALAERCTKAFQELRIATGIGAYVISEEVSKILIELEARPEHNNPWDSIEADAEDYSKALAKVRELAKRDLRVR